MASKLFTWFEYTYTEPCLRAISIASYLTFAASVVAPVHKVPN